MISLAPTSSRFYYFAQLEDEGGRPLSAPLALDPNVSPTAPVPVPATRCPDARPLLWLEASRPGASEAEPAEDGGRRGASPERAAPGAGVEIDAESRTRRR
jgi:hypothetical protein